MLEAAEIDDVFATNQTYMRWSRSFPMPLSRSKAKRQRSTGSISTVWRRLSSGPMAGICCSTVKTAATYPFPPFLGCTFERWFDGRFTRRIFFSVETSDHEIQALVLHEGQGMAWFTLDEILARATQIVPYDLGVISLHHSQRVRV